MEGDPLYCAPCGKQFTGWANIVEHNNSPAHQRTVAQNQQIDEMTKSLTALPPVDKVEGHESLDEFMKTEDQNMFLCELCNITCSGKIPALSHVRGKSHRQKKQQRHFSANVASSSSESKLSDLTSAPASSHDFSVFQKHSVTGHFFCTVCKLSVSGEVPAQQHLLGKSHAKKIKIAIGRNEIDFTSSFSQLSLSTNPSVSKDSTTESNVLDSPINQSPRGDQDENDETDISLNNNIDGDLEIIDATGQWHCTVCQVSLNSKKTVHQHFLGKAHQKKKKAAGIMIGDVDGFIVSRTLSQAAEEVGFDGNFNQWKCNICNVSLTSEIALQDHLSGKAHQKRKAYCQVEVSPISQSYSSQVEVSPISQSYSSMEFTLSNTNIEQTLGMVESVSNPTHNALIRLPSPSDPDSPLEGQPDPVAWERSPCLDENTNRRTAAVVPGNMMRQEDSHQLQKKSPQLEGCGFDPAAASSSSSSSYTPVTSQYTPVTSQYTPVTSQYTPVTSQYTPVTSQYTPVTSQYTPVTSQYTLQNNGMQEDSPYWSMCHDTDIQESVRSNSVRPPPGFGNDVLPSNRPMSDFLAHQFNAITNPPSHMHRFWSIPSAKQEDSSSKFYQPGLTPGVKTKRELMPPIGTPSVKVPEQLAQPHPKLEQELNDSFTMDRETQKLVCKICDVFVTGRESAESHLSGSKHAKKFRVYQFQKNHMEPQVTIPDSLAPHSQYYSYHNNRFSSTSEASSSVHCTNSIGSTSVSSESYDYNSSTSSSNSSGAFPPVHRQTEEAVGADDRFQSLRGASLGQDNV